MAEVDTLYYSYNLPYNNFLTPDPVLEFGGL